MRSPKDTRQRATVSDLLAIAERERFHELIDGEIIEKATPTGEHGDAQAGVTSLVRSAYHRRGGGGQPGGWWIYTEVEVLHDPDVVRPDVVGWRRERVSTRPVGTPIAVRPDWICEVISPSRPSDDTLKKMRLYQRAEIGHYWLIDPREETLSVYRWTKEGFLLVQKAARGERLRAEPFDALELPIGVFFGGDEDD
jgi:Uma2 family endonuclease